VRIDGRTDGQEEKRADMMKLIIAFRNFGNGPKTHNSNIGKANVYRLKTCERTKVNGCVVDRAS